MSAKDYADLQEPPKLSDNTWEEEIKRLKHDIKKTENRIIMTEKRRKLFDKAQFEIDLPTTDAEAIDSENKYPEPYCLENVERVIPGRQLVPRGSKAFRTADKPATPPKQTKKESDAESDGDHGFWVSPSSIMRKRPKENLPPAEWVKLDLPPQEPCPESPKRIRSSPPGRNERNQNREWLSPHRVIDLPNPEDSHGNWVSMRGIHQRVVHSPLESELLPNEIREERDQPNRPFSQSTYTIRRNLFTPDTPKSEELPVTRKTTVLNDFEPELHDAEPKRRVENLSAACHTITTNENMKRIVHPDGHIVKVSTLGDISVGIAHAKNDDNAEAESKVANVAEARNPKGITLKKIVMKDMKGPITHSSPRKCKGMKKPSERKNPSIRPNEEPHNDNDGKPKSGDGQKEEGDDVIAELKKIFNDQKNENEFCAKRKSVSDKTRCIRQEENAKRAKTSCEEKKQEVGNRRKDVDMSAVQKYIKLQKMKRIEQLKSEREREAAEKEAKKKKLEGLRIRTLQLAGASKKKVSETAQVSSTIKIVETEAETEEDMTISLGLKQTKPKVSYNESILNLKKKTNRPEQKCDTVVRSSEPDVHTETKHETETRDVIHQSPPSNTSVPSKVEHIKVDIEKNTNLALKKLAETLQLTLQQQKKAQVIDAFASTLNKEPDAEILNKEQPFAKQDNQKSITIDMETIKSLKNDIKKISEDFQILHEIIIDKSVNRTAVKEVFQEEIPSCKLSKFSSGSRANPKQKILGQTDEAFPFWLKNMRPHPYNVLTAVRNKMKLSHKIVVSDKEASSNATHGAPLENKYDSDSDTLPSTTNQLSSTDEIELISSSESKTEETASEDKYYSFGDDSGSEMSSSILDSEKHRNFSRLEILKKPSDCLKVDKAGKGTPQSFAAEDVTSTSLNTITSDSKKLKDSGENLVLIPPNVQLVSNTQDKTNENRSFLKSPTFSLSLNAKCCSSTISEEKSENMENNNLEATEVEEIVTESIRNSSVKVDSTIARFNEVCVTRSFFNPEALHVQFQAELTLLETFQRSLSHFLEVERIKALSHAEKLQINRAVNTESIISQEVLSSRESCADASSHDEETESVKTELEIAKMDDDSEESAKAESDGNDQKSIMTEAESEKKSSGGAEKSAADSTASKKQSLDSSDSTTGISLQMLNRMVKDEELRSEHQLALIRLREKTLNEKVKAELTFLEIRKKALKEKGSEEEQAISAIKKKQRGILLKYQSEKEDIERLKKMHKIASEERKIMIKQQKQIQKMQLSTKDMLIKLKKREKSPQKRIPIKLKAFKYYDSQSDLQEDISINASDNLTDSVTSLDESINRSIESDIDVTSKNNASDGGDEILKRNMKMLKEKISKGVEKSTKIGGNNDPPRKHLKRGHSADELLKWTKRLEEKENWLKEMENQVGNLFHTSKHKTVKSFKDAKISMRDRSTSPFQFQEIVKSICETSPSLTEVMEVKNSSSIAELIEGNSKTEDVEEMTGKSVELPPEKHPTSASEDIQEEFSKKTAVMSRSVEYNSESFESPSSSDTHKSKPVAVKSKSSEHNSLGNGIMIKMALSPRVRDTRRRYSSGSDESLNLFQTETASEQSDVEIRIAALHEQLRCRKLEAERLRREQKRAHRERLKAKEQSLIKQIEAYDSYIQKKKQELQQEYERTSPTFVRPIVRQPKISEKVSLKRADASASCEDELKTNIQTKFMLKKKELDVAPVDKSISGNDKESDSEIVENIKTLTEDESVKEEIVRKDTTSTVPSDTNVSTSRKNISDSTASSMVESLPMQSAGIDGSHSESEDQTETNVSVKTTLLSPEKPDLEVSETTMKTDVVDNEEFSSSEEKVETSSKEETEIAEEMRYLNESFESEKSPTKKTEASTGELVNEELKANESINTTDDATSKNEEIGDEASYERSEYAVEEEENESFEVEKEIREEVAFEDENEVTRKVEVTSECSAVSEYCDKTDGDADRLTDVDEVLEVSAKMTDLVTESILGDLMSEALEIVIGRARKKKRAKDCGSFADRILSNKVDIITDSLASEMISEVIDDALRRYNRKKRSENDGDADRSSNVRRRVIEIMSQTPTVKREHRRPQDLMVTTYDLPAGVIAGQEFAWSEREEFLQSLSPSKDKSVKIELSTLDIPAQHTEADAYSQEWFDDDFGLSRTRREAEELRLQQLQIEQEIQQLQAQQEQVPYYYLRQIPNKPPPPYTPPGTATAERFTSEAEITSVASMAVRVLSDELESGKEFSEIEAPASFFGASDNDHVKCYKVFLFDLVKHILSEAIGVGSVQEEKLPWMRTSEKLSKYKMKKVERTFECLLEVVMKQVLVLFGFRQKMGKERLIVRWSRKKRDHVDEILVGESQEEESEWTQYDEDEVTVKNNVAMGILDSLLDETAQILNAIWLKKSQKTD